MELGLESIKSLTSKTISFKMKAFAARVILIFTFF